jgi:transposase InsO family protein
MPDNNARVTTKDPAEKIARKRLSVLQLSESLGNVTEACRKSGMDRASFYIWKKRFTERGLEGLKDLSNAPHHQPNQTPPEVVEQILEISLQYPRWGCTKISDYLKLRSISVSSPTVQKIFIKNDLASVFERTLRLEQKHLEEGIKLSEEQIKLIERINPVFSERHVESSRPGELLCQDVKLIGTLSGIGRIYAHCVVDTYGSFAFAFLHTNKIPEAAVAVVYNDVLPQYKSWKMDVEAILTDNGREFCGREGHPYELYLELNDIEHRKTKIRSPKTNGFAERFIRTLKEEFVGVAFRKKIYSSIDELQEELDSWLHHYNYERPHRGYRNMGKRPIDTVQTFIKDK